MISCGVALVATAQCTLTNATSCVCADGSNDCDLLPNIKLSKDLLEDLPNNPETPGLLRVSVSTPNVGHGPLVIKATNNFVCDLDTFFNQTNFTVCPGTGATPRQLVKQTVYHKSGNTMTSYERWASSMTFHPTHGHAHFDDWGQYTLRLDSGDPNPLNWPIIGQGAKLGFCVMDYGTCSDYPGQCRDANNNVILANIDNYGLGTGNYNCNPTNQGITVGFTDIYYQYLDGMYITIPPGTCNGPYKIVVHVDPHNVLLEENDVDNVIVADYILTQQSASGPSSAALSSNQYIDNGTINTCDLQSLTLSAPLIGSSYLWSTGETTPDIHPTAGGQYTCTINTPCGVVTSDPITVAVANIQAPIAADAITCEGQTATLNATVNGTANWYDAATGGNLVFSGNSFTTPILNANTSFFVENQETASGVTQNVGELITSATNQASTANYGLNFTVHQDCTLKSVLVNANAAGSYTFEIRDAANAVVQSTTVTVPQGENRVTLNLPLTPGDFKILCSAFPNFKRINSNNALPYPYSINNVLDITSSTYQTTNTNTYYYFFDWEVQLADAICRSNREEVAVTVQNCAGVNSLGNNLTNLEVLPNPSTDGNFRLNFATDKAREASYVVSDVTGKRVVQANLGTINGTYTGTLNLSGLASGVYMLQIITDGDVATKRLVVSK